METKTFGQAARAGLTSATDSQRRSTGASASPEVFAKHMRLWLAMLPRKNSDDVSGELMAEGYSMMLGDLSEYALESLTKIVLERCKWFPTIAECKAIMGEESYSNPFYVSRRSSELTANGYPRLGAPLKAITHD